MVLTMPVAMDEARTWTCGYSSGHDTTHGRQSVNRNGDAFQTRSRRRGFFDTKGGSGCSARTTDLGNEEVVGPREDEHGHEEGGDGDDQRVPHVPAPEDERAGHGLGDLAEELHGARVERGRVHDSVELGDGLRQRADAGPVGVVVLLVARPPALVLRVVEGLVRQHEPHLRHVMWG